jgi:hypothetical protein
MSAYHPEYKEERALKIQTVLEVIGEPNEQNQNNRK